MQTQVYPKPAMTANAPRKTDATATMDRAQFLDFCRAEKDKRNETARIVAEEQYCLRLIGTDQNNINHYAVVSVDGDVYQFRAGRTYKLGVMVGDTLIPSGDPNELCPDEHRIGAWNARLAAMGEASFIRTKHVAIRFHLFMGLPEVA